MAKAKLKWRLQNDGNILVATILDTSEEVHFHLTKLKGWEEFKAAAAKCAVGMDSFIAGMQKKLAQPCGGTTNPVSKWKGLMEELYKSIYESDSYAQRKSAEPKIAVSDVVAGLQEMLDDGTIDEAMYQVMLSKVGQARAK